VDQEVKDLDAELARVMPEKTKSELQAEADGVDIYKYKRRWRTLKAIGLGAALAGFVALIMSMVDGQVNPCEKVTDYLCKKDPAGLKCKMQKDVLDESVHDSSATMRAQIRADCAAKIERIKEDDGVDLK
jgi:hypothetical protein